MMPATRCCSCTSAIACPENLAEPLVRLLWAALGTVLYSPSYAFKSLTNRAWKPQLRYSILSSYLTSR